MIDFFSTKYALIDQKKAFQKISAGSVGLGHDTTRHENFNRLILNFVKKILRSTSMHSSLKLHTYDERQTMNK